MRRNKRRTLFAVLTVILLASALWLIWGNTSIQTTQISLSNQKIPASFDNFKIVQVSDLHNDEFGTNQRTLLKEVAAQSPDLIVVTGDLIDSSKPNIKKAMAFIDGALALAPVYFVTGNHEAWTDEYAHLAAAMSEAGVVILRNEAISYEHKGESILVLGLDDPAFNTRDVSAANPDEILKGMSDEGGRYRILLSHRPELFDVYAANDIDLILSGHAHGGQVRLPLIGALAAPGQGFFPAYSEGTYELGTSTMIVSRGLGNSVIPLRVNNRPELVVVILKSHLT